MRTDYNLLVFPIIYKVLRNPTVGLSFYHQSESLIQSQSIQSELKLSYLFYFSVIVETLKF